MVSCKIKWPRKYSIVRNSGIMLSSHTKTLERSITMEQLEYSRENKKGKHLNYEDRVKIEALSKAGT